jgi:glycosyltransferase involved in cell wall biosynthesis
LKGKRIYVIPTAVEVPELLNPEERQSIRETLVGDAGRPLIASVGRLTAQKGYTYLLDGFSQVRKRWPQAALVIAGEGDLYEELSLQIRGLNLDKHAFLLGPRPDVQRLLGACDIFISSSLWEGLPSALLEGMAAGLPVVATTVGDMPRVVPPEVGLLIPPAAPDAITGALTELLDHPQQRKLMGEAAREYVITHHGLDAYGKHFLHMYKDVISRENPPSRRQAEARQGL